ncbi:hypothetical protein KTO58_05495 [Chitinophaga pendula]|uniref:DUF6908 domain-containing protein n=1 Tax=Chitinophaga TaxID=79328 RepID=UPI000BAFD679|nr:MULTISPECIES: hypothetical protein [Chitinophaga]ASZ13738.1 hypothetical protein CK934_23675 [Chitinophaga sp. MD30]UCJ08641.1 hypothetical protein KTO58_05495 [Chitinophaga pendula]
MRKLNQAATKIFSEILKRLGNMEYIKIEAKQFMPLTVELLDTMITTESGEAKLISLCHYHQEATVIQRDPEMRFIVIDGRTASKEIKRLVIIPQMFRQDNTGINQDSIIIENNVITRYWPALQVDHTLCANQWLANIQQQGYLK